MILSLFYLSFYPLHSLSLSLSPSFSHVQVETLRKQDTSLQLNRTRDELSASLEKSGELESQLEDARGREDTLRSQLRQVEQKWREVSHSVSKRGREGWKKPAMLEVYACTCALLSVGLILPSM